MATLTYIADPGTTIDRAAEEAMEIWHRNRCPGLKMVLDFNSRKLQIGETDTARDLVFRFWLPEEGAL